MNKQLALRILTSLADGRDPETGVVLPRDHVFQQPDVIRALAIAVETVRGFAVWRESVTPARAGAAWTEEEEKRLRSAFEAGKSMSAIADKHQRSVCAIATRLESLGCTNEEVRNLSVYTPEPPPRSNSGDVRPGAPDPVQPAVGHPAPGTMAGPGPSTEKRDAGPRSDGVSQTWGGSIRYSQPYPPRESVTCQRNSLPARLAAR